jgi:hypothetical protein
MSEDIDDVPDEVIIKVTDYVEGKLTGAEKADVEAKIASVKPEDRAWKQTHDEMVESMAEAKKAISGIRPPKAPETFVEDVTNTIHKRSGGHFFARRTLGDRVPFGVLLVIAVVALAVVGYLMWSSPTGSLAVHEHGGKAPAGDKRLDIKP